MGISDSVFSSVRSILSRVYQSLMTYEKVTTKFFVPLARDRFMLGLGWCREPSCKGL